MNTINNQLSFIRKCPDYDLFVIDLFCGAGGVTTGVESANTGGRKYAKVIACVNHDPKAIESHAANHKDVLHFTEDIRTLELSGMKELVDAVRKNHPRSRVWLHASIECTNFSRAKGGMSRDADSRTLAEHLYRYIDILSPDIITIENVEEFLTWGPLIEKVRPDGTRVMVKSGDRMKVAMLPDPEHKGEYYRQWTEKVCSFSYHYDYRILNSADYGAYTSRRRYFGFFARKPEDIVFPRPTHAKDPCANIFEQDLRKWLPVKDVLDFTDEGSSIFDRNKPLVEATLKRIKSGLFKFVGDKSRHFLSKAYGGNPDEKNIPVSQPAGSVTTKDHHQFVSAYYKRGAMYPTEEPAPSYALRDRMSMVFIDNQYGNGKPSSINGPTGTIMINPKQTLIEARRFIINPYSFKSDGATIEAPSPVVIARQDKCPLGLATAKPEGKLPSFITQNEDGSLVYNIYPEDSETMRDIKVFMCENGIVDVTMRMLRIGELKKIQGFPDDYILVGTQQEQKKFLGNAVVTVMARALCEAIVQKPEQ